MRRAPGLLRAEGSRARHGDGHDPGGVLHDERRHHRPPDESSSGTPTTGQGATSSAATGASEGSVFRGLYNRSHDDSNFGAEVFTDCASQQRWNIRGHVLPDDCSALGCEVGFFIEALAILHPDGPDEDDRDELEVLEFLQPPCSGGSCIEGVPWTACGDFSELCDVLMSEACDVWKQDCPEGQKCAPTSLDGDCNWESTRCVPVVPGAGQAGDACTSAGIGVNGNDTCAKGHICYQGTCVAHCAGSSGDALCAGPCQHCSHWDTLFGWCFEDCDPLVQDCATGELCVANPADPAWFWCIPDDSGDAGLPFAPCKSDSSCDPGLWCAPPTDAVECDQLAPGCCLPFCDLAAPACPGADQKCLPWDDSNIEPSCLLQFGSCRLPP